MGSDSCSRPAVAPPPDPAACLMTSNWPWEPLSWQAGPRRLAPRTVSRRALWKPFAASRRVDGQPRRSGCTPPRVLHGLLTYAQDPPRHAALGEVPGGQLKPDCPSQSPLGPQSISHTLDESCSGTPVSSVAAVLALRGSVGLPRGSGDKPVSPLPRQMPLGTRVPACPSCGSSASPDCRPGQHHTSTALRPGWMLSALPFPGLVLHPRER